MTEPSEPFTYPLDSAADMIRDAAMVGEDEAVDRIIARLIEERGNERVWEGINAVVAIVLDAKRPRATAAAIAVAGGMHVTMGMSMKEFARKRGVSKQAMSKLVTEICGKLKLKPSRAMRSAQAREEMRKSNWK